MKYKVEFRGTATTTVTVEADDPEDARDKAWEELPGGLCIHCSGFAEASYNEDAPFREWPEAMEPYEVTDDEGETVWKEDA